MTGRSSEREGIRYNGGDGDFPAPPGAAGVATIHEYTGNIHIHSRYSDGTGTVRLIARAARRAGLDFIIITDHRTLAGRKHRGWHSGLLVLAGEELGQKTGHYLGLGLHEASLAVSPQEMIDAVAAQGGVGFVAHPDDPRYGWPDWRATGFDGFSLWNFCSQWRAAMTSPLAWAAYLICPHQAVTSPPAATRARWDGWLKGGRLIPAIGASDAHAFGWRPLGLPLVAVPYGLVFRAINTHVLLSEPLCGETDRDERLILEALRRGSCFIANHRRGPARGFRFWAEGPGGPWGMGHSVPAGICRSLETALPGRAWIVLLRDGVEIGSAYGDRLRLAGPAPGAYRVEVYRDPYKKWGWIFSNPIRIL